MARKKQYIGVDIHHDNFFAYYIDSANEEKYCQYSLSDSDIEKFKKTLTKRDEIAIESTSNASFFLDKVDSLISKSVVVHPYQFRVIAQSSSKTDKNDAFQLAFFLKKRMLPTARLRPFLQSQVLSLASTRALFLKSRQSLFRKTYSILIRHGIKVPKTKLDGKYGFEKYVFCHSFPEEVQFELNLIYKEVKNLFELMGVIDEEIVSLSKEMDGYQIIRSIPGMGKLNSAIILACIVDVKNFSSVSKLASFFGITPRVRISNNKKNNSRITKMGHSNGRRALYQSTFVAIRCSTYLNKYYKKQKINKGAAKKAIIATSYKYLKIIYNCLKEDTTYEEYVKQFEKKKKA